MTGTMNPQDLMGMDVYDTNGEKVGKVGTVYVSDSSKNPQWITVKGGFFGQKESIAPLAGAQFADNGLRINATKETVRDAPQLGEGDHLTEQDGMRLYQHYGMTDGAKHRNQDRDAMLPQQNRRTDEAASGRDGAMAGNAPGMAAPGTTPGMTQDMTGGTGTDPKAGRAGADELAAKRGKQGSPEADGSMVRSEERLSVNTETVESGRARLHKYVVTEEQQLTVPVSHEEVRLEREPITEGIPAGKATIGEDDQEVILHAEKPVVHKETVPVERVRLNTETVTEQQTVGGEVRKEQIEMTDPTEGRDGKGRKQGR